MKKPLLLISILTTIVVLNTKAQIVNIPDPIFKNFLVNHWYHSNPNGIGTTIYLDANHDGEIQVSEATNYPGSLVNYQFNVMGLGITDLTGIEAFQSIKKIYAGGNQLTSINVDACSSLKYLNCSTNPLTSLIINNASLEELYVDDCSQLTSVDIHNSQNVKIFNCQSNPTLTNINLKGCWFLQQLRVNYNPILTSLDFGVYIYSYLNLFQCYNNAITSLDMSHCTALANFYCTGNQLTSLNLANGHMNSFQQIFVTGYPNLFCVQVDNVSAANFLWGNGYPFLFDSWVTFTTDCSNFNPNPVCTINIPDVNFKTALLANPAINTNNNTEIECTEAAAYTGAINVDGLNIANMTGIEAFVNITSLSCNNQQPTFSSFTDYLDTLNISGLSLLTSINCTGNVSLSYFDASGCSSLTSIDIKGRDISLGGFSANLSNCTSLVLLNLNNKNLNALNVSACSSLIKLDCGNNQIISLDVSGSPALTSLICNNNQLTSLNTFNNSNIDTLNCSNNQLPYLIVSMNTGLIDLNCSYNNISYLDLYNNTNLITLNCSHNNLNTISVNNNPSLYTMNCSYNNLSALNVSTDTALNSLNCEYNQLTNLNVNNNTALVTLHCGHNILPNLNLNNNPALKSLYCPENNLSAIDLSHNLNLLDLDCSNNQLSSLDLIANTEILLVFCAYNQLTTLDFRHDTALVFFQVYCNNNQLTDLDFSNTFMHFLYCDNNNLQTLNIANGQNLNSYFRTFANDNPNLTCVQVDSADYSTTNWINNPNFLFDANVNFSENCGSTTPATGTDIIATCGSYLWIDGNTYTSNNDTATYTFVGGSASGNDSIVTLNLTIYPLPQPVILQNGDTLSTQAFSSYQWLKDGFPVSGATSQSFIATANGNYSVIVTDTNGCETQSNTVSFSVTGITTNLTNYEITAYPNPTNGIIYFSEKTNLQVSNVVGQIVADVKNVTLFDLSAQPAGTYLIILTNDYGQVLLRSKIIKNN